MSNPALETLAKRLDRLEREVRRWRMIGISLTTALALFALIGATAPGPVTEEIRARRFIVVGKDNTVRARLEVESNGRSALLLSDQDGKTSAKLFAGALSQGLDLYGEGGNSMASLAAIRLPGGGDFGGRLQIADAAGKGGATLSAVLGESHLSMRDKDGQDRVSLAVTGNMANVSLSDGEETKSILTGRSLGFHDSDGATRAALGKKDESWVLQLADAHRGRAQLAVGSDGAPSLKFSDETGIVRAALGHTSLTTTLTGAIERRPASSLVLLDKDGTVVWKAP